MFRTSIKIGGGEGMKTKKARRSREINALLATKAAATQITCVRLVQELNAAQLWLATRFSNIDHGLLVVLSRVYNCRCLTLVVLRTSNLTEETKLSILKSGNPQYILRFDSKDNIYFIIFHQLKVRRINFIFYLHFT